jgi:hypothetical protein
MHRTWIQRPTVGKEGVTKKNDILPRGEYDE